MAQELNRLARRLTGRRSVKIVPHPPSPLKIIKPFSLPPMDIVPFLGGNLLCYDFFVTFGLEIRTYLLWTLDLLLATNESVSQLSIARSYLAASSAYCTDSTSTMRLVPPPHPPPQNHPSVMTAAASRATTLPYTTITTTSADIGRAVILFAAGHGR